MKSTAYQTIAFLSAADDVQRNPAINSKSSDVNNNDSQSCAKLSGEKYSLRQRQKRLTVNTATATATAAVAATAAAAAASTTDSFSQSKRLPMKKSSTIIDSVSADALFDHKDTNSCADGGNGKEYVPRSAAAAAAASVASSSRSKEPKAKTKAAPLSKYRRKTANARERTRMREINSAFENLRHCVPHTITGDVSSSSSNEKLTKITTLRLAMKYIKVLSEALANPTFEAEFLLECKNDGDHRFTTFNWTQAMLEPRSLLPMGGSEEMDGRDDDTDEEDDNLSDVIVPAPPIQRQPVQNKKKSKSRNTSLKKLTAATTAAVATTTTTTTKTSGKVAGTNMRKAPTKRQRTKQKLNDIISPYSSSSSSSCSSTSSTSAYASMSSSAAEASPPSDSAYFMEGGGAYGDASSNNNHSNNNNNNSSSNTCHSMTDLSNFGLLESDGESLPSCLSPLHQSYNLAGSIGFTTATHLTAFDTQNGNSDHRHQSSATMPSLDDNPLELSLRLLESSDGGDSLDFSSGDHQPTTCISPLVTLDSFNPFADLLHSEFSEHNALDLFLT